MNKKRVLNITLVLEALLCVALSYMWIGEQDEKLFGILKQPFELLGSGLRHLSLSGTIGNAVAMAIYIAVCLIPVGIALYFVKNKKARFEDTILLVLSTLLFRGIYIFVNPGTIAKMKDALITGEMYKIAICTTIVSVIILYVLIKAVRSVDNMKEKKLLTFLKVVCGIAQIIIVGAVFYIGVSDLFANIQKATENNQYITNTYVLLVFRFLVEQTPNICVFLILTRLMNVAEFIKKGFVSEEAMIAIKSISSVCKKSVMIMMFASVILNIVQLLVIGHVSITHYQVDIPVFQLLLVVVLLIITKIIEESNKIKEDNDLFI